jgi:hypothetical protein
MGPTVSTNCGMGASGTWRSAINPYTKNTQIFACPSNQTGISGEDRLPGHYAWATVGNGPSRTDGFSWDCGASTSMALVDAPADTVGTVEWRNGNPDACWNCTDQVFCGHSAVVNYGLLDGHTKAYKPTWAYVDASNRGHWFFDLRPAPSEPPRIPAACK